MLLVVIKEVESVIVDKVMWCLHAVGLTQAHSCFQKAVMIVGLQHWRKLPASGDNQFAVQPQQLAEAVAADLQQGLIPFYFLGTIGEHSSSRSLWSCTGVVPAAPCLCIGAWVGVGGNGA